jgi:hypothetical protein
MEDKCHSDHGARAWGGGGADIFQNSTQCFKTSLRTPTETASLRGGGGGGAVAQGTWIAPARPTRALVPGSMMLCRLYVSQWDHAVGVSYWCGWR